MSTSVGYAVIEFTNPMTVAELSAMVDDLVKRFGKTQAPAWDY